MIRITGYVQVLPPTNCSKFCFYGNEHSISDNDCMNAGTPISSEHGVSGEILGIIHLSMFRNPIFGLRDTICIYLLNFNIACEDDLLSTGDKAGNAWARIACGLILAKVNAEIAHWILIIILAVVVFSHCDPDMSHFLLQKVFK